MPKTLTKVFVRNIIFGIEDSLVSTVGLLAGIATDKVPTHTILLTGAVYVSVEALSMAVGSFLSEESVSEMDGRGSNGREAFIGGAVMFVSFVLAGFIPVVPYLLLPGTTALAASVAASLVLLFALGYIHARMVKVAPWLRALRMALLGGGAIILGIAVARIFGVS